MKQLILLILSVFMFSSCTSNPIDQVNDNINSGNIDKIPELKTESVKPSDPPGLLTFDPAKSTSPAEEPVNIKLPGSKTATPDPTVSNPQKASTQPASAVVQTSKGPITIKLFPDIAPKTVSNFISKAQSNYYSDLTFHRVEDWVVQGGDPLGNGTGGGNMPTELSQTSFKAGSVGVARGPDIDISNDSQFFICKTDCSFLTNQYTLFGEVTAGMEVVNQIKIGDKIKSISL